jgi:hypothetical protein
MRSSFRGVLLASILLATVACKQSDSVLFVTVYGQRFQNVITLNINVGAGTPNVTKFFPVSMSTPGEPISWPASFTISLDRSVSGPITISVDAVDAGGTTIASGTTTMQHIEIGGQTDIAVMLSPSETPDGGTGPVTDAGQAGADGGAGGKDGGAGQGGAGQGGAGQGSAGQGGAGQSGASGQGGAAGVDASAGGATGLDGATD